MLKGMHFVKSKPRGRTRWHIYAWRGGPLICTRDAERKPSFSPREIRNILQDLRTRRAHAAGTLKALVLAWRSLDPARPSSDEWRALPPATKRSWGPILGEIEGLWGGVSLDRLDERSFRGEVIGWRDKYRSHPRQANARLAALVALLDFGCAQGWLSSHTVRAIAPLPVPAPARAWSAEEVDRLCAAARREGMVHVSDALRLMARTGVPFARLVTLRWADVGAPQDEPAAGRARVHPASAISADFAAELRSRGRLPGSDTILVDPKGRSWTTRRLRASIGALLETVGITARAAATRPMRRGHLGGLRRALLAERQRIERDHARQLAAVAGSPTCADGRQSGVATETPS